MFRLGSLTPCGARRLSSALSARTARRTYSNGGSGSGRSGSYQRVPDVLNAMSPALAAGAAAVGASVAFAEPPKGSAKDAAPAIAITPYAAGDKAAVVEILNKGFLDMLWPAVFKMLFSGKFFALWSGAAGGLFLAGMQAAAQAVALAVPVLVYATCRYMLTRASKSLAASLDRLSTDGKSKLWVARNAAGRAVGSIAVTPEGARLEPGASAELVRFAVDPAHRRNGVGADLLIEALVHCKEKGVRRVHLVTSELAVPGMRLYERAGFRVDKVHTMSRFFGLVNFSARKYVRDL
eukprot:tig00001038_g6532.t1